MITIQIGWSTTATAERRLSVREQLKEIEFDSGGKSCKIASLIQLGGFEKGTYLATLSVDTVEDDYRLLPVFIDSQSLDVRHLISFDEYRIEGVNPEFKLGFSANADDDTSSELIVQVGWHYDNANAVGWFYQTYIYDRDSTAAGGFIYKKESDSIIPNEAQAVRQGERLHAKYNTEVKIRRRLKELGYKQYQKEFRRPIRSSPKP